MEVKEKKISCGISQLINTGNYSNVTTFCEREVTVVAATDEEVKELHKELYAECLQAVEKQGQIALKKLSQPEE